MPSSPFDCAMPDVPVVGPEADDRVPGFNCYDPAHFRPVVEVGASAPGDELTRKPAAYAAAGVPVRVVVDRAGEQVVVLTEPRGSVYRVREVRGRGEEFTPPPSIGASVTFAVADLVAVRR
ncbi:Uma2 family endonuclease [Kitasatospora purpeofusca]|uniref:Uma2 family endonuclease n=1 Tax=Kitasatospora purpeofusca TaxID=67352 RepID=UPI0033E6CF94